MIPQNFYQCENSYPHNCNIGCDGCGQNYCEGCGKDIAPTESISEKPAGCCDGECNHDDCCGKITENCTHSEKPQGWEAKFENESPLAFGGRAWAKSFIASEIKQAMLRQRHYDQKLIEQAEARGRAEERYKFAEQIEELQQQAEKRGAERAVEYIMEHYMECIERGQVNEIYLDRLLQKAARQLPDNK